MNCLRCGKSLESGESCSCGFDPRTENFYSAAPLPPGIERRLFSERRDVSRLPESGQDTSPNPLGPKARKYSVDRVMQKPLAYRGSPI